MYLPYEYPFDLGLGRNNYSVSCNNYTLVSRNHRFMCSIYVKWIRGIEISIEGFRV